MGEGRAEGSSLGARNLDLKRTLTPFLRHFRKILTPGAIVPQRGCGSPRATYAARSRGVVTSGDHAAGATEHAVRSCAARRFTPCGATALPMVLHVAVSPPRAYRNQWRRFIISSSRPLTPCAR